MEDIYFLSKDKISLEEIKNLCVARGIHDLKEGVGVLNVYHKNDSYIEWRILVEGDGDYDAFEDIQKRNIEKYMPGSIFQISYHISDAELLVSILKDLMGKYGGHVCKDDGVFEERYNIDALSEKVISK